MKLNISERIRKLRRDENLTQEALADVLGVSVQAVSRWETAATYPDIELLPVIAAHFGVSVDELLGVEKTAEDERLTEYRKQLDTLTDDEQRLDLLREMNRAFPNNDSVLFDLNMNLVWRKENDCLDEQRRTAMLLLSRNIKQSWRDIVLSALIAAEDDDNLPQLLDKYTTDRDMRRLTVLESRYELQNMKSGCTEESWNKADEFRQLNLHHFLGNVFCRLGKTHRWNVPENMCAAIKKLDIINYLTGVSNTQYTGVGSDRIIDAVNANTAKIYASGDGVPDLWTLERYWCGICISCYLAVSHKTEAALNWLEDTVSLYERFYSLPDGTELTYRCDSLEDLVGVLKTEVKEGVSCVDTMGNDEIYSYRYIEMKGFESDKIRTEDYMEERYQPVNDIYPIVNIPNWSWFDNIRDDARYIACVSRMRQLCVPFKGSDTTD